MGRKISQTSLVKSSLAFSLHFRSYVVTRWSRIWTIFLVIVDDNNNKDTVNGGDGADDAPAVEGGDDDETPIPDRGEANNRQRPTRGGDRAACLAGGDATATAAVRVEGPEGAQWTRTASLPR